jgi:hypothetical protein
LNTLSRFSDTTFRRAAAASLASLTIVFRFDSEQSFSAAAPDPADGAVDEGDVSVLPSDFPRGVVGLFDGTGFVPCSVDDGFGWDKNFPRMGADDMVDALLLESSA